MSDLNGVPGIVGWTDLEAEARAEIDAFEEAAGLRRLELIVPPFDPDPDLIDYSLMGKREARRFRRSVEADHEAAQRKRGRLW